MSAYRVIVLARADRDVRSIFAWLWSRSPKGAERWLAAFESAKEKLTEDPAKYALIPENVRSPHELRHVLFKTRRVRQAYARPCHRIGSARVSDSGARSAASNLRYTLFQLPTVAASNNVALSSGEAVTISGLGRQGAWDRFAIGAIRVHFQYTESECIRLVSVMAAADAP